MACLFLLLLFSSFFVLALLQLLQQSPAFRHGLSPGSLLRLHFSPRGLQLRLQIRK